MFDRLVSVRKNDAQVLETRSFICLSTLEFIWAAVHGVVNRHHQPLQVPIVLKNGG